MKKTPIIDINTGEIIKEMKENRPQRILEYIEEQLPHGSGIDYAWNIEDKGNYIKCENAYHTMNEDGFYDAIVDFSLIIPKDKPEKFRLHFHGKVHYIVEKYMLRNYLEDLFALFIYDILEKHGNIFKRV